MAINEYRFVTFWKINAPLADVWNTIGDIESFPEWWKAVKKIEIVEPGDGRGVNAVVRQTWRGVLPYRLSFVSRTTEVDYHRSIALVATGGLEGEGRWTFGEEGELTTVRYDWNVRTTGVGMTLLALALKPLLAWNHDGIMRWGESGLSARLKAKPFR